MPPALLHARQAIVKFIQTSINFIQPFVDLAELMLESLHRAAMRIVAWRRPLQTTLNFLGFTVQLLSQVLHAHLMQVFGGDSQMLHPLLHRTPIFWPLFCLLRTILLRMGHSHIAFGVRDAFHELIGLFALSFASKLLDSFLNFDKPLAGHFDAFLIALVFLTNGLCTMFLGLPLARFYLAAFFFRAAVRGHHFAHTSADSFSHFRASLFAKFDHLTFDRLHRRLHDLMDACASVAGDLVDFLFDPLDRVSTFIHSCVQPLLA